MGLAAVAATRTLRPRLRPVRCGLFADLAFRLPAGVGLPQAFQCFIERCVMALLRLAFHTVIFPDPGVSGVCIAPEVTGRLGTRLLRFDREFHSTLFACSWITFHHWFTHRTHLSRLAMSHVSVCPEEYSHISVPDISRDDGRAA